MSYKGSRKYASLYFLSKPNFKAYVRQLTDERFLVISMLKKTLSCPSYDERFIKVQTSKRTKYL